MTLVRGVREMIEERMTLVRNELEAIERIE